MPSLGSFTLAGKSGTPYRFRAYPLGTTFKKGFAAVYIVTQRKRSTSAGGMQHKPLLLGQSEDLRQPKGDGDTPFDINANCICVHAEQDHTARKGIQEDLVSIGIRRTDQ